MLFILTGEIQTGKTRWLQRLLEMLEAGGIRLYGVVAPGIWKENRGSDGEPLYEKLGIQNEVLPQHERIEFARRVDLMDEADVERSCTQAQRAQLSWAINDEAIEIVNRHFDAIAQLTQPGDRLMNPSDSFTRRFGKTVAGIEAALGGKVMPGTALASAALREKNAVTASEAPYKSTASATAVEPADALARSPFPFDEYDKEDAGSGFLVIDEFGRLELLNGEGLTSAIALIDRGATPMLPHALIVVRAQLLDMAKERFSGAPWNGISVIAPDDEAVRAITLACSAAHIPEA